MGRLSTLLLVIAISVLAVGVSARHHRLAANLKLKNLLNKADSAQAQFAHASPMPDTPEAITALQKYVNTPDSNYKWEHLPQFDVQGDGYKVLWLNMTSQRWLSDADCDRPIWYHWLAVIIPSSLKPEFADSALLWITGGSNGPTPPKADSEDVLLPAIMSVEIGIIVGALFQIPNQPTKFFDEKPVPKGRTEDALIAWAWKHYIEDPQGPNADATWLPRLPMTKASIRAMDAISEFWQQQGNPLLSSWLVAGASKRGWTTWTVGICDPQRVKAILPMVLDELNFVANIKHHFRAYGGWSFALKDYYALNFTAELDNPMVAQMMTIVDPIAYKDILTMPKLIISTAGDEFLLPDNVLWFWSELQGEKHFHLFPNAEHSMITAIPDVLETIKGFALLVLQDIPRPVYSWNVGSDGKITFQVDAKTPPSSAMVWAAQTIDGNERRDFRLVTLYNSSTPGNPPEPFLHPVFWEGANITPNSTADGLLTYEYNIAPPAVGWIGFVLEFEFPHPNGGNSTFRVSSAPSIVPQTFPYPECFGQGCYGTLL